MNVRRSQPSTACFRASRDDGPFPSSRWGRRLVRFLVRDDQAQAARARRLIVACAEAGDACLVSNPVLCELEWVLESVYHASLADVAAAVRALLSTPPFELEDARMAEVGRSRGSRTTYTFDRGLRKAEGFTLL